MLRLSVGGDAEGGYLVDVHDGDRQGVYSPTAKTAAEAIQKALKEHAGEKEPEKDDKDDKKPAALATQATPNRPVASSQSSSQDKK